MALALGALDSAMIRPASAQPLDERPTLLSDTFGKDSDLAKHGVNVSQSVTQFYGGVVSGGVKDSDEYSGRWDLLTNIDGEKAGLWPGLFLKMRVGANWNPIERFRAGSILAPYSAGVYSKTDEESIAITDLSAIQMFSPNAGLTFGKMDTVDGDFNSFAHGRGLDQFENLAFVLNPVLSFIPLSTLGAGVFALYDDGTPAASLTVLDTHNVPTESGFDDLFDDGAVISATVELPTTIAELRGRHRFGYAITTADQIDLSQNPRFSLETDGKFATESNSWVVTYNGEQFLVTDPNDPKKGWGLFARAAISDSDKNIFEYFLSAGLGGTGGSFGRGDDRFGLGYFHLGVSDVFEERVIDLQDEDGVELFYSVAVLPWVSLTADAQFISGTLKAADDAYILSGRLQIRI